MPVQPAVIILSFISDIDRVNMGIKNIDLLLNNKIDENDFVDIMLVGGDT